MTLFNVLLLLQNSNEYHQVDSGNWSFAFLGIFQIILMIVPTVLGVWLFIKVITYLNLRIKLMRRELNDKSL